MSDDQIYELMIYAGWFWLLAGLMGLIFAVDRLIKFFTGWSFAEEMTQRLFPERRHRD